MQKVLKRLFLRSAIYSLPLPIDLADRDGSGGSTRRIEEETRQGRTRKRRPSSLPSINFKEHTAATAAAAVASSHPSFALSSDVVVQADGHLQTISQILRRRRRRRRRSPPRSPQTITSRLEPLTHSVASASVCVPRPPLPSRFPPSSRRIRPRSAPQTNSDFSCDALRV